MLNLRSGYLPNPKDKSETDRRFEPLRMPHPELPLRNMFPFENKNHRGAPTAPRELETPVVFGGIYDPEATLLCRDKVGQELTLTFGAKFDRSSSVPITAKGTVLAYIKGWNKFHGVGDIALFRSCGVDIVLSENHIGYGLPAVFGDLGRNPADMQIVVCKLGYLTAQQAADAKRSIMALSKGSTNEDLTSLDYRHIPRPIFPLDTDFSFEPAENLIRKTK